MKRSRHRFDFDDVPDAARLLFEHSTSLTITITRDHALYDGIVGYELHGGFTAKDGGLNEIAADLLRQFAELPRVEVDDDDD